MINLLATFLFVSWCAYPRRQRASFLTDANLSKIAWTAADQFRDNARLSSWSPTLSVDLQVVDTAMWQRFEHLPLVRISNGQSDGNPNKKMFRLWKVLAQKGDLRVARRAEIAGGNPGFCCPSAFDFIQTEEGDAR